MSPSTRCDRGAPSPFAARRPRRPLKHEATKLTAHARSEIPAPVALDPDRQGPPGPRQVELAHRLNSTAVHLLRRIGRDDGADRLTGARLSALAVIAANGPISLSGLARKEGVAAPTMTRLVDGLVGEGLVERAVDPADRRAVRITVTPTGRRLLDRGRASRVRHLVDELATLDAADLDTLERALDLLARMAGRGARGDGPDDRSQRT